MISAFIGVEQGRGMRKRRGIEGGEREKKGRAKGEEGGSRGDEMERKVGSQGEKRGKTE